MKNQFKRITIAYREWGNVDATVHADNVFNVRRDYRLTEASYNRLVWLANNSDAYQVTFGRMGDDPYAWSLIRTSQPARVSRPFFPSQSMADPYASPLANPRQCQVEPDGQILFA